MKRPFRRRDRLMSMPPVPGRIPEVLAPSTPLARRPWLALPPVSLTPLIGRESEMRVATSLLRRDDVRLLTLTGPGGIGKTRLAIALAAELEDAFADGVGWVSLASVRDPALVVPSIARALGIVDATTHSVADALAGALRSQQVLLVLDNFEQIVAAAPHLAELLAAAPTFKVLVTSRSQLRVRGEHIVPVPSLVLPDPAAESPVAVQQSTAVRLFIERAQAVAPAFALTPTTAPLVAEVCRRLDGLPLAIELAAARVYYLPLPALRARLDHRLPLLTDGPRDLPDRLRTMRDAIEWSYDLLSPDERALFRRLSVFAGGFTLEAAEAVTSASLSDLATVVDASLVRYEPGTLGEPRYNLFETIREYAAEQLLAHGEADTLHRAHATYFLALAERHELADLLPNGEQHVALLAAEHPNLRAALDWLDANGEAEMGLRLAAALGRFWTTRGYYREGLIRLQRALARERAAAPAYRAKAHVYLGYLALYQGARDDAENHFSNGLICSRENADGVLTARALIGLGALSIQSGDHRHATELLEEAIAASQTIPDERLRSIMSGSAQSNLGVTAHEEGDLDKATAYSEQALRRYRQVEFRQGILLVLINLGKLAIDRDDFEHALALYREILELNRSLNDPRVTVEALDGAAVVAAGLGQMEWAARWFGAADSVRLRTGFSLDQPSSGRIFYERAQATTRATLGEDTFAAAHEIGRSAPLDEVIAEVMAVPLEPEVAAPDPGPEQLGAPALGPAAAAAGLTPREAAVLRLLAAGLSNQAIAEALFVERTTVKAHLRNIFAKLGVTSRAAAAIYAHQHGLIDDALGPSERSLLPQD